MPNILDDIIASVVENKIPPNRTPKINVKSEVKDEPKDDRKIIADDCSTLFSDIPHSWICDKHVLWLSDHKNCNNWKLFRDCWKQGKVCFKVHSMFQKRVRFGISVLGFTGELFEFFF